MRRSRLLLPLALAASPLAAQTLPVEVSGFYQDWNQVVSRTTLWERRELWAHPQPEPQRDARLAGAALAMERIRARWIGRSDRMPTGGYDGFPVWSFSLEVAGVEWKGPDVIQLTVSAYPTAFSFPARSPVLEDPQRGAGRTGLTHTWWRRDGVWVLEQAIEVLI